jgi:exonuclease III
MIESNKIIGGFWNIRGLNKSGRMKCLANFINQNRLDFVGIQETKKASIEDNFLDSVNKYMNWKFVPAKCSSGGILVVFKNDVVEIIS